MTSLTQTVKAGFLKRNQWRLMSISVLLFIAAVLAWRYYESRYPSWYEEVRLSDGRIITIHQKREYYENYGTSQSWVTIDLPELGGKRVWHSYLMPQRADLVDGKVYVFGIPRGAKQLEYYRFPKYYMVAFQWTGASFERIPFQSVPVKIRDKENTFSCVPKPSTNRLLLATKTVEWCPARGANGELGKELHQEIYKRVADHLARAANWTDRSE